MEIGGRESSTLNTEMGTATTVTEVDSMGMENTLGTGQMSPMVTVPGTTLGTATDPGTIPTIHQVMMSVVAATDMNPVRTLRQESWKHEFQSWSRRFWNTRWRNWREECGVWNASATEGGHDPADRGLSRGTGRRINSWTSMVRRLLAVYSLPSAFDLVDHPPHPEAWKNMVTTAVNQYWEERICSVAATYPSLRFMDTQTLKIGTAHPAVTSISSNPFDTVRSRVRLKLLTGSYVLQSNRPAFNQSYSRQCVLCKSGDETREHFLLICPALQEDRAERIGEVDEIFTEISNIPFTSLPTDKQLAVIIDPSNFILQGDTNSRVSSTDLARLEAAIRALCFRLHSARNKLQARAPRRNRKPKRRKPKESQAETSQAH